MLETQTTEASEASASAAHQTRRAAMEAKPFDGNLGDLVERFCKADPAAVAWVFFDSDETLTRHDVFDRVTRLASSLSHLGLNKGRHVAVMMPNISAFPVTWLALA